MGKGIKILQDFVDSSNAVGCTAIDSHSHQLQPKSQPQPVCVPHSLAPTVHAGSKVKRQGRSKTKGDAQIKDRNARSRGSEDENHAVHRRRGNQSLLT